ncbi:MAG: Ig-like domain-containing protein, partial [Eubacteriales bacterium]|nr:Ig-like domain-containing protein [Eubacteriales bacterium]
LNQFYSYLDGGYRLRYMTDASHSYYQNSNPGAFYVCAKSNSEKLRAVYDDVYAFIKHTYVPHIPTLTSKDFKTEVDEKLYGYINAKSGIYASAFGEVAFEVTSEPAHGTLELNTKSGDFSYIPETGFEGTDSFTVVARNAFVQTEPYVCNITVGSGNTSENSAETSETPSEEAISSVSEESKNESTNKNDRAIPVIAGAAAITAAAVTAAVVYKNKKKKNKQDNNRP